MIKGVFDMTNVDKQIEFEQLDAWWRVRKLYFCCSNVFKR